MLRVVPNNPDPAEFPAVKWACAERPKRCHVCSLPEAGRCPFPLSQILPPMPPPRAA